MLKDNRNEKKELNIKQDIQLNKIKRTTSVFNKQILKKNSIL